MSARDPKPEILRLEELALLVKAGEIKLPRFQRPFVWKRPDMLKLLDSIYRGYPIGSLLLWHSSQRLRSERNIAGLEVDDQQALYPTNYLLDGQQRLTTLCGALFWQGESPDSIWDIHFDLESESFVHPKDGGTINLFPLNRLIGTSDFIRQCMKFEHHANRNVFVSRAERLLRSIKDYKIAVVKIGDMSLEEVAPIFERINSTGRKLTMVDLMMAATWSDEFDLAHEISRIVAECRSSGFDGIPDPAVLRSIAATAGLGINKDDIQKLRSLKAEALIASAATCRQAMLGAVAFLVQRTPIREFGFLPYGLQLTHLTEIFHICPQPSNEQSKEMLAWFWLTSATQYFGGASTGQNAKDLARTRAFARGEVESLFDRDNVDITRLLFDKFNLRNASSTTFALLLLNAHPTQTMAGKRLSEELQMARTASAFGTFAPTEIRGLNLGRVIDPYQEKIDVAWGVTLDLSMHLLSEACVTARLSNDVNGYVQARAELVGELISKLGSCRVIYRVPATLAYQDEEQGERTDDEDRDPDAD